MDDRRDSSDGFTPQPAVSAAPDIAGTPPANPLPSPDGAVALAPPGNLFTRFFTSHPAGFWFFFWGELAERSCFYGMRAILFLYMVELLGFSKDNAGSINYLFIAACYFLPLIGGYLADNFFGKYWTIV